MGNTLRNMNEHQDFMKKLICDKLYADVKEFQFHEPFSEDDFNINNGLVFNHIYLPTEVIIHILSFIDPKELINLSLVCKSWSNLIKSNLIWREIYTRRNLNRKAKNLPWFVYYNYFTTNNFRNLIKNGNGQLKYLHWEVVKNFGDEFKVESTPVGADPLPKGVPEFYGATSCFATSYYECNKIQRIPLEEKRLLRYIMNKYQPHIYVSEWISGRFDCACIYQAAIWSEYANDRPMLDNVNVKMGPGECTKWQKIEMIVEKYEPDIKGLIFEHEGHDTQFWKGHYGSKMAGAVVKFLFDSIIED